MCIISITSSNSGVEFRIYAIIFGMQIWNAFCDFINVECGVL